MTPPTIRAELATAVRAVNAAFDRLPVKAQNTLDITVDPCGAEVDKAILAGDRPRAMAAIRAWRQHWIDRIERAGR